MFDVGRSRFYKKIRRLLKLSKTRVDAIIKKRKSIHKYLKNDIADLLKNGLDVNAYGRAEGLLVELNMSSCYDFIELCVSCILAKLSAMERQRECPNECREAAQSLMHAAARFADMPELRELRTVFTERYGNSLERFLNKEFAEKLRSGPPTKEKKLQLLQDIAQEYSIPFDVVSFEQKMFKPAPPVQEKPKCGFSNDAEYDGQHRRKDDALPERDGDKRGTKMSYLREKPRHRSFYDSADEGSNRHNRNDDAALPDCHRKGCKISNLREHDVPKRNEEDLMFRGKKGFPDDSYNIPCDSDDEVHAKNIRNSTRQDSQQSSSSSIGSFFEEEVDGRNPLHNGSIPPHVKQHAVNKSNNGSVNAEQNDESQPTSARKSTLKLPPGREVVSNGSEENAKKGEKARLRMQSILNKYDEDQIDEEEEMLDELLMQYSKKKQPHDSSKVKENLNRRPWQEESGDTSRATRHRSKRSDNNAGSPENNRHSRANVYPSPVYGSDVKMGARRHKSESSELPNNQPASATCVSSKPAAGDEGTRGHHGGAKSMQQLEMVGGRGHVHPNLPDYDDLAVRLAALRGK